MQFNQNKAIAMLGTSILCFSLVGCQDNTRSPKTVTSQFLNAYHELNEKQIKQNSEWSDFNVKTLKIQDKDYIKGVDIKLQKDVYTMMLDFKHQETSEKIEGNKADVNVDMTIYNFQPTIDKGTKEATKKVEELSQEADISDAQSQIAISKIIFENMKKAKMDKKQSIVVHVVKKDHKWVVSNNNKALKDLLSENTKSLIQDH